MAPARVTVFASVGLCLCVRAGGRVRAVLYLFLSLTPRFFGLTLSDTAEIARGQKEELKEPTDPPPPRKTITYGYIYIYTYIITMINEIAEFFERAFGPLSSHPFSLIFPSLSPSSPLPSLTPFPLFVSPLSPLFFCLPENSDVGPLTSWVLFSVLLTHGRKAGLSEIES